MLLSTLSLIGISQPTTDQQLAAYYFQEEDFEKAVLYYEKLYKESYSDFFYQYYLDCLFNLKSFKDAKKLVKLQMSINPNNLSYKVDYGMVYKFEGDPKKAEKQFVETIEELPPISSSVIELANAFQNNGEFNYALQTYTKGDKLLNGTYPFNFEKARLFGQLKRYQEMVNEYLSVLLLSENYLQSVQNELARNFAFEQGSEQNSLLKQELIKLIQKHPGKPVFSELLIWVYMQEGNYSAALLQTKALDKRLNESGERLINLANIAMSNQQLDVAIESYEYVVTKGKKSPYYTEARISLMDVLKEKLYNTPNYKVEDVLKLKGAYLKTIEELFLNARTAKIYRDFAHLEAFYLNNADTAITILIDILKNQSVSPEERGMSKLILADVYMLKNLVWDASLLYSQVDKSFKYDQLGEQAKFRNAKVSYYVGDFSWAKAQLDVLKGSTSKLIANDAMELSLLITDNTGLDSNEIAMQMFARADLRIYQNNKYKAWTILDSITTTFPGHALADEVLMRKYQISLKQNNLENAEQFLLQVLKDHPTDITADNATFYLAELYEGPLNNKEKAMEKYQDLLLNYPNSMFVVEARKRFRLIRGDNLEQ